MKTTPAPQKQSSAMIPLDGIGMESPLSTSNGLHIERALRER
jgi:hypothetical protein